MPESMIMQSCHARINEYNKRYDTAPFPMCITPKALYHISQTIGRFAPETGGKLFGSTDRMGIEVFEFDNNGSQQAKATVYAPDTEWGTQRVEHHINANPARFWWGDIHSHPSGYGEPSRAVGDGLGDLGYATKVFEENEAPLWYFMPILTQQANGIFISPFIVHRDRPHQPFIAPAIHICAVTEFPEAEYNPAFLARIEAVTNNVALTKANDIIKPYWTPERTKRYFRRAQRRRERLGLNF